MLELMAKRRSIRKFTGERITPAQRDALLKAALLAPSSKNLKPVEFVVVEERETLDRLQDCRAHPVGSLSTAAMAIAVIADTEKNDVWAEDASIAATHLMLEAEALDLGACWIQVRLRECADGRPAEEFIRELLGIPAKYAVLCLMVLGHKDEHKESYDPDALPFEKVHSERF